MFDAPESLRTAPRCAASHRSVSPAPLTRAVVWRDRAVAGSLTAAQTARYDDWKRSRLHAPTVKRVIGGVAGTSKMPASFPIVMGGIAKLFVGDVVERAREVMAEWGHIGPIRPLHLREAHRRITHAPPAAPLIPQRINKTPLFKR